jgi:hypothetical protein
MDKMYNEGGFADDGATVEPVTGNEVPPGSLDQEVRDDVDAKLSEGEYVIPANVVRFIGLNQIERMISEAKKGLTEMEANGRIGGEPVDPNGVPLEQEEELTPEEMQMLSEALGQTGMAMGGMVQPQMYNPYEQQQMQYTVPNTVGMQEGGLASQFNPQTVGQQFSPTQGTTTGGPTPYGNMEIVEFINPETGQTMMVTLLNGNPLGMVPEGFVRSSEQAMKKPEEAMPEVDKGETEEMRDNSESEQRAREQEDVKQSNSWAEENYEAILNDPVGYVKDQLETTKMEQGIQQFGTRAGAALAGPLGAGLGAAASAASALDPLAKARGTRDFMKELGLDTSEVDSAILDYEDSLPGVIDTLGDTFATGKRRKNSLLEIHQSRAAAPKKVKPKAQVPPQTKVDSGESDSRYAEFREEFERNEADAKSNPTGSTTGKGLSAEEFTDDMLPGMKKGGLVSKPSNYKSKVTKKKTKRGLGSK